MNEELIAEAEIGDEAKKFIESDLGRCLLGMADQEVRAAQEALEIVDPGDLAKIQRLQNLAWCGRHFRTWLIELFDRGEQALEIYKHEQTQ